MAFCSRYMYSSLIVSKVVWELVLVAVLSYLEVTIIPLNTCKFGLYFPHRDNLENISWTFTSWKQRIRFSYFFCNLVLRYGTCLTRRFYPWSIFEDIAFLSVCNVKDGCYDTNWHPVELWSLLLELPVCRKCRSRRTKPASNTPRPSGSPPTRTTTSMLTRLNTTVRRYFNHTLKHLYFCLFSWFCLNFFRPPTSRV